MFFSSPESKYPGTLKDMSFDYRAMCVYHICMLVLFGLGQSLSIPLEAAVVVVVLGLVVALVARNKIRRGWHRPATRSGNWLKAFAVVFFGLLFLMAATPLFPPTRPFAFPWYAAGFGIVLFNFLQELRIVQASQVDFIACCNSAKESTIVVTVEADSEPRWKKIARSAYSVAFLATWLTFVAFFYEFGTVFKNGSATPTSDKTETLVDHGRVAYVSTRDKQIVSRLEHASMLGIPTVLVLGFVLHFGLGVRIFSNLSRKPAASSK